MTIQEQLKNLEAEWNWIDQDHRAACEADEREVVAGRLDKNIYIERDVKRAARVASEKAALSSEYFRLLPQREEGR